MYLIAPSPATRNRRMFRFALLATLSVLLNAALHPFAIAQGAKGKGEGQVARLESELLQSDGDLKALSSAELKKYRERLDELLDTDPNEGRALILRGMLSLQLDQVRSARADFEQAVRVSPRLATAHYNLGVALDRLGDRPGAQTAYEKAVSLAPGYAAANYNLGRVYEGSGEYERAEGAYYAAWLANPQSARILVALGNIRWRQKDYREALIHYDEAASLDSRSGLIQENRAITLEALGRYEEARQAYKAAVDGGTRRSAPRLGWGRCALRLGLWDEMEEALDPLASLANESENSAKKLLELGRTSKEAWEARKAAEIPEDPQAEPQHIPAMEPQDEPAEEAQ